MNIAVHYLFSNNKKIGSKLIRWATSHMYSEVQFDEIPSHVAILINQRWVFESTIEYGVRRIEYSKWLKINNEVNKFKCTSERDLTSVIDCFRAIQNKKYDFIGAIYFGIFILLNKWFKIKIPKTNKWNGHNKYFCSEVMGEMLGLDYQMTSPVQIMIKTKDIL